MDVGARRFRKDGLMLLWHSFIQKAVLYTVKRGGFEEQKVSAGKNECLVMSR